jgi:L-fucose isomerase-like protein
MSALQAFAETAPGRAMTQPSNSPMVLGVIVGNRGFFPDHLARSGRQEMISTLTAQGIKPIALGESDSKYGAVETRQEAARCADLFKKHREEIDGVVVTLPNFGDERAIAETLRMSLGTTKWHMHQVLRKLAVRNRTAAAAKARSLGLL